jgi:hypothetical protein
MTLVGTARGGTLEEFRQFYQPGDATRRFSGGDSLLSNAMSNKDPVHRAAIANFLLDEGADPTWRRPKDGGGLLHVLFGWYRNNAQEVDLALLRRLLVGGADVNAVNKRWGTPLQTLLEQTLQWGEDNAVHGYLPIMLDRDDLDLFRIGNFKRSTYRTSWVLRERRPVQWSLVQKYVADHGVQIPESEQDVV